MTRRAPKTVIIAGQGALTGHLVASLRAKDQPFVLAEMEGFPADVPGSDPIRFRVERLVPFFDHLADLGVTRVCFAGAVRRPRLEPELFDARTATLVPRLLAALQAGDDGALRTVIALFEEWGFTVVGAHEIAPDLLPPAGVLTRAAPMPQHHADAECGESVVEMMGREDSGQACVVAGGQIIAKEGPDGTDAMMRALLPATGDDKRLSPGPVPAQTGGILFKAPKPEQDRRADLPVIGPETALMAAEAGLAGIVIEAGGVMVLDQSRVREMLDGLGLFLWVRPHGFRR